MKKSHYVIPQIVFLILMLIPPSLSAASVTSHEKKNIITDIKLHKNGEPNNFGGKALQLNLDRALDENSNIKYQITIKTKSHFTLENEGWLTTSTHYDNPEKVYLFNVWNWLGRHASNDKRKRTQVEVIPGNIDYIHAIILQEKLGLFGKRNIVLADVTYTY